VRHEDPFAAFHPAAEHNWTPEGLAKKLQKLLTLQGIAEAWGCMG